MFDNFRSSAAYKIAGYIAYPVALVIFLINKYIMIGMGVLLGMLPLTFIYISYSVFFLTTISCLANNKQKDIREVNTNIFADIGFVIGGFITVIFLFYLVLFWGMLIAKFLGILN